jgi:thiamine-phosphate pyrophosphorylase
MRGLYAIADVDALHRRGLPLVGFASAVLAAGPVALQLRAKNASAAELEADARVLLGLCRAAGVPFVLNDAAPLAARLGCDIVHVGQGDLPISEVRRFAPEMGVGVSTHSLSQLDEALAHRPTYVAMGPVFATSSKANPEPVVGLATLEAALLRTRAGGIPLVAIGGVDEGRIAQVAARADAVAVIGALLGSTLLEVETRARVLVATVAAVPLGVSRAVPHGASLGGPRASAGADVPPRPGQSG